MFFIGCVDFSAKILSELLKNSNVKIVGLATMRESSFNSDFFDISRIGNIPFIYTNDINNKSSIEFIKNCNPDIIYCFGWSKLIKKELLNLYPIIGFHPAKLPKNRGRNPITWALFLNLSKTASTFFIMDEDMDSGRILSQKEVKISKNDDAQSLYDKIVKIAIKQVEDFTTKIACSHDHISYLKTHSYEQNLSLSNIWRKRSASDGIIDFRMNSEAIYNLVRALSKPYCGADVKYKNIYYKIWKTKIENNIFCNNIECGKILNIKDKKILVKTYNGAIWLVKHEIAPLPKINEYF
ncbi:TPA: formyltransferase family protein [Campylobacter lari]